MKKHSLSSILIYCEGAHDQSFVKHLQQIYKPQKSQYYFDIKKGQGGSPHSLVEKAFKLNGAYTKRIVLCDDDRGDIERRKATELARKIEIEIIMFQPCIEAILLMILQPQSSYSNWQTEDCKKQLYKLIPESKRLNQQFYIRFKHELVEAARNKSQSLHRLLELLESNN